MRALVLLVACSSPDAPSPAPAPAPAPAPTPAARPAATMWKLTISSDYGPCSPSELRPCHTSWTVQPDGVVEKLALANDPGKQPVATRHTLSPFDRDALRAIIAGTEFRLGMANGFACQGAGHDPDATLQLAFVEATHGTTQYVEHCTHGADAATTLPSQLLGLIRR